MSSIRERSRNNVKAGIFVTLAIGLALVVIVVLSGAAQLIESRRSYVAYFDVTGGVSNLKPGGEVRIGGVPAGGVSGVTLVSETEVPLDAVGPGGDDDTEPVWVRVEFDLDADFELREDARLMVSAPLVGSDAWLTVLSFGRDGAVLAEDGVLVVDDAPSGLSSLLGEGVEQRIASILESVDDLTATIAGRRGGERTVMVDGVATVEAIEPFNAAAFLKSLEHTADEIDRLVSGVRGADGEGVDRLQRILAQLDDASANISAITASVRGGVVPEGFDLDAFLAKVDSLAVRLDDIAAVVRGGREDDPFDLALFLGDLAGMAEAGRGTLETVDGVLEDHEDDVRETIRRASRMVAALDEKTIPNVNALLEDVSATVRRVNDGYGRWEGDVDEILASAKIAGQQLALATQEVRRAPWKVLYRPEAVEVDNERLYQAARAYAFAADTLRVATENTNRLLDRAGDALGEDPELVARLRRNLSDPLRNHEEAQQRLLEILLEDGAGR